VWVGTLNLQTISLLY
jgi:hypothetical protein